MLLKILDTYFSFKGRLGRVDYLIILLSSGIGFPIIAIVVLALNPSIAGNVADLIAVALYCLFVVALFWTIFAAIVRRLHDLGWTGYYALLAFVPLINLVLLFGLLVTPGMNGNNEYGAPRALIYSGEAIAD